MRGSLLITTLLICNLSFSQVTIKGVARNIKDTIIVFKETGGFTNITRKWRDIRYKARVDKKNQFVITLPEQDINRWLIETEDGYQFFDLIKGKDIELIADFSKAKPLTAIGNNADDFNYLTHVYSRDKQNDAYREGIRSKNIDSVLLLRKQMASSQTEELNNYKHTHNMSEVYYRWMKSRYTYEPYERTSVENIDNKDPINDILLSKLLEKGIQDDYAALNTLEYNDLVEVYMRKKFTDAKIEFTRQAYFDFGSNLLKGKTRDVFLTRFVASLAKADDSIYSPVYKKYNERVEDNILKNYVTQERNEFLASLKQKEGHITQYASLNGIFSKYTGKVIYVDFWASWCVPCRGEMPFAAELKKQLKGKDLVFVYMGYKDTEKAWLKARKELDIEGEHYLLNDTLRKEAEEAFNISGIPHYVIIDKAGNIVNKHADRPGNVYTQLSELVNKN